MPPRASLDATNTMNVYQEPFFFFHWRPKLDALFLCSRRTPLVELHLVPSPPLPPPPPRSAPASLRPRLAPPPPRSAPYSCATGSQILLCLRSRTLPLRLFSSSPCNILSPRPLSQPPPPSHLHRRRAPLPPVSFSICPAIVLPLPLPFEALPVAQTRCAFARLSRFVPFPSSHWQQSAFFQRPFLLAWCLDDPPIAPRSRHHASALSAFTCDRRPPKCARARARAPARPWAGRGLASCGVRRGLLLISCGPIAAPRPGCRPFRIVRRRGATARTPISRCDAVQRDALAAGARDPRAGISPGV